jgi:hypothetical protein
MNRHLCGGLKTAHAQQAINKGSTSCGLNRLRYTVKRSSRPVPHSMVTVWFGSALMARLSLCCWQMWSRFGARFRLVYQNKPAYQPADLFLKPRRNKRQAIAVYVPSLPADTVCRCILCPRFRLRTVPDTTCALEPAQGSRSDPA